MPDDSRLGYVEASVEQQNANFERLYQQTLRLETKIDDVSVRLEQKIDGVAVRLDQKIDGLATRVDHLDHKFDRKFDDLRIELSKQFRWTVGMMVTTMGLMVTLIGLVAGLLTTALR